MKISLVHASYKSSLMSLKVRNKWFESASNPEKIEHCLGFEENDESILGAYGVTKSTKTGFSSDGLTKFSTTKKESTPSAIRNWNAAASLASGEILVVIADDLIPEPGWDLEILKLTNFNPNELSRIWKVTDYRCSKKHEYPNGDVFLPRHPIITRHFYAQNNFIFDPRFLGVGVDDHLLLSGLQKKIFFDARHIKLHHSIGPIFDTNMETICGCSVPDNSVVINQTEGQLRIHTSKLQAEQILSSQWSPFEIWTRNLLCDPIFAKFSVSIRENQLIVLKRKTTLIFLFILFKTRLFLRF